jgi:hypothetical protein
MADAPNGYLNPSNPDSIFPVEMFLGTADRAIDLYQSELFQAELPHTGQLLVEVLLEDGFGRTVPTIAMNLVNLNSAIKLRCQETCRFVDSQAKRKKAVPYVGKLTVLGREKDGWQAARGKSRLYAGELAVYTGRTFGEHYGNTTCTDGKVMKEQVYEIADVMAVGPMFLFTYPTEDASSKIGLDSLRISNV